MSSLEIQINDVFKKEKANKFLFLGCSGFQRSTLCLARWISLMSSSKASAAAAVLGGGNAMLQLLFPARSEKQNEQEATHDT